MTRRYSLRKHQLTGLALDMQRLAETLRKRAQPVPVQAVITVTVSPPTEAEYRTALARHDWQYEHADDYSAWKKGQEERQALRAMQVVLDKDMAIWNRYAKAS